jgi:dipeptidyl aminopeptidase/acylaminoacyl peptidase
MINYIKILSNVLLGISVLVVSGPTLGEMIATMAPIYPKKDELLVRDLGIPFEEVSFQSDDGNILHGWYFPSGTADSPAILYAPATGKDQRSGISLVAPLHQAGYHVLLFSYRGHGRSEGNRFGFTYGANESWDIDAAVSFLSETKGVEKIGVLGHSAGAASGIISAARNTKIDAVVAAAPFPSVEDIWNTNRPSFFPKPLFELTFKITEYRKQFSRNQVRPQDIIAQISPRPLLLIHGIDDQRITQNQAMELFDAAKGPKCMWLVEGASHAEVRAPLLDSEIENLIAFFDQALGNLAQLNCGIENKAL